MVGELSKYQKLTVTPESESYLTAQHTLGVMPKIVIVTCDSNAEPYTVEGYNMYAVATETAGVVKGWNKANHNVGNNGVSFNMQAFNST